jgi:hypothetical protein
MQVTNSLDDGSHDGHGLKPGKVLFRLLLPQGVQIRALDILHQEVEPAMPGIIEHLIDPWESLVRQLPEQSCFKEELMPLSCIEIDYLLENEEPIMSILITLITDQVDGARGSLAQDTLDTVVFL